MCLHELCLIRTHYSYTTKIDVYYPTLFVLLLCLCHPVDRELVDLSLHSQFSCAFLCSMRSLGCFVYGGRWSPGR